MLILVRTEKTADGIFGHLLYNGRVLCVTLEPPSIGYKVGCAVAAGEYLLTMEYSPKFHKVLPTIIVNGRSGIRIHAGNYARDTKGCILVGVSRGAAWINNSRIALNELIEIIKENNITQIRIINLW